MLLYLNCYCNYLPLLPTRAIKFDFDVRISLESLEYQARARTH